MIVALVPRIVPYEPCYQHQDAVDLERSSTRLVDPSLNRVDRPWEGQLPDAMRRPRSVAYRRLPDTVHNLSEPYPLPAKHYLPTPDEPNAYVPGGPYDPRVPGGSTIPHESLHPDEQYAVPLSRIRIERARAPFRRLNHGRPTGLAWQGAPGSEDRSGAAGRPATRRPLY
ncbi:MAG: hypothetical protein R3B90_20770 [Planctomycetaceae bacterium]